MFISDSLFYLSLIKDSRGRDESPGRLLGLGTLSLAPVMAMLVKNDDQRGTTGSLPQETLVRRGGPTGGGTRGQGAPQHPLLRRLFVLCVVRDRWRLSAFYSTQFYLA